MLEWALNKLLKRADELEERRRRLNGESTTISSIDEWMRNAYKLQQSGKFDEAEALYRKILFKEPAHADALFMLSEIKLQQGQYDQATELCRKAVEANDDVAVFHASLAGLYNRAGALDKAEAAYREAVRLDPENPEYVNNLGSALLDQQRSSEALECFEQALRLKADLPHALYNVGMIRRKWGELDQAIHYMERALALESGHLEGLLILGDLYLETKAPDRALESYKLALERSALSENSPTQLSTPQLAAAHMGCGSVLLLEKNQAANAIPHLLRAVELDKTLDSAWVNLGIAYGKVGRLEDEIPCLMSAIGANPSGARAFSNLAIALDDLGSCERAKECLTEIEKYAPGLSWRATEGDQFCQISAAMCLINHALSIEPTEPDFLINKGVMQEKLGDHAGAVVSNKAAIKLNPELVDAHLNMSMELLLLGEMEEGWEKYEWRIRNKAWPFNWQLMDAAPLWNGEPLNGRSLLVHAEQGLGDTIQFIRYQRLAAERCDRVMVLCQPAVKRLLRSMPGMGEIYAEGELVPEFDFQIPLMSLPHIFGTRLTTIPVDVPYLFPQPERAEAWAKVASAADGLKVGLVWAGNKAHKGNRFRSLSLNALAPLGNVPGISFFSLQKGEEAAEAKAPPGGMRLIDHSERLSDFVDTAALIANLDLVIAVDTSVAHLAGALGKQVWVLVPFCPDFRWLLDREDSPWYPSMRLFRQMRTGDWASCLGKVRDELERLAAKARQ